MKAPTFFDDEQVFQRQAPPALKIAKVLSIVMDSALRLPFTQKTIGLDALVGSLPVLGDALTALVACYLLGLAVYYKVPTPLFLKMLGNVAVDFLVGSIPLLGDVFDVLFKANVRNYALLFQYLELHRSDLFIPAKSSSNSAKQVVVDL